MSLCPGVRLRALLRRGECLALPGAFNGLVARLAHDAGFEALYVSGGAISAASGVPDVGLLTLESFCRTIREVTVASGLPCLADADTGFGEVENAVRTLKEYYHNGAGGLHVEDQTFAKRCGHLDGKTLISLEYMAAKITRMAEARNTVSGKEGMVLCARTDARETEGMEAAVARAKAYVQAGADMIFPEGLHSKEEFIEFASALRSLPAREYLSARGGGPFLVANMTEFGKTPIFPISFFRDAGYDAVIFPVSTLRVAMNGAKRLLETLKREGSLQSEIPNMMTRSELYQSLRYTPGREWIFPCSSADR